MGILEKRIDQQTVKDMEKFQFTTVPIKYVTAEPKEIMNCRFINWYAIELKIYSLEWILSGFSIHEWVEIYWCTVVKPTHEWVMKDNLWSHYYCNYHIRKKPNPTFYQQPPKVKWPSTHLVVFVIFFISDVQQTNWPEKEHTSNQAQNLHLHIVV